MGEVKLDRDDLKKNNRKENAVMTIEELKSKYKKKLDNANRKLAEKHNDYVSAFQISYEEILEDLMQLAR